MDSVTGPGLGLLRAGVFRPGGTALASTCRATRRCVLDFSAAPWTVPTPNRHSRRICSKRLSKLNHPNIETVHDFDT